MASMLLRSLLLAFFFLTSSSALQQAAPTVPDAYIAELASDETRDAFYSKLGADGHAVKHRMDLTKYRLFNAVSFQLQNVTDSVAAARKIESMPVVQKLWPVRIFNVPNDEVVWTAREGALGVSSAGVSKRQSSNARDTFSPHVMTQVDKLRANGITGAGVRVAVVDTGVDYNHPALGGGFGPGYLVSFGTDLVGDDYTGFNTPVPDPDPLDECEGHGTHVSGIIAAQTNPYDFTGAAPDVTLGAYRVFGCGGSAGNDVLIGAFNQAYEDGADIITASIGGPSGWSEDAWAVAVQRIVEAGVPCTVSAGNDGQFGQFYASTAANGKRVTAVASVDNTQSPSVLLNGTFTVSGGNSTGGNGTLQSFGWAAGSPDNWGNITLPLYAADYDTTNPAGGCDPYPADTPDLSGYLVLIRRGTCTFVQKAQNAVDAGAKYVMIYNNVQGVSAVTAAVDGLTAIGSTSAAQGAEWIGYLSSGANVTVNIIDPDVADQFVISTTNTVTGGFLSTYTSWGPTYELDVKPQVSAPGGNILSTYPLALGGYAVLSGTSMACPITAAVVALVGQVRGTFDPATIESRLASTANPNLWNDGTTTYDYLAPVQQQGAGLIQGYDAAYTNTTASVSYFAFNDTANFEATKSFSIRNIGAEDITYELSNVGAATAYTFNSSAGGNPDAFPNELVDSYASIKFSSASITLRPGARANIQMTLSPPTGLDEGRLPVYGGYVVLNGTNGDSLSIPYQGVLGSMYDQPVLDKSNAYLSRSTSGPNYPPVGEGNAMFVLPSPAHNSTAAQNATSYPVVVAQLFLGTAVFRADVVPVGPAGYGNATTTEVLGVETIGSVSGFPAFYQPRGTLLSAWDGTLEGGSVAPAGTYKVLMRALKIFGDPENADDYDTQETVAFTIRYR